MHSGEAGHEVVHQRPEEQLPVQGSHPMALQEVLKKKHGDDRPQKEGVLHGRTPVLRSGRLQVSLEDPRKTVHRKLHDQPGEQWLGAVIEKTVLAQENPQDVPVSLQPFEGRPTEVPEKFPETPAVRRGLGEDRLPAGIALLGRRGVPAEFFQDDFLEQGFFAGEIMVDETFGDTGLAGDLPVGGLEVPFVGEAGQRRVENLALPLDAPV